MCKSGAYRAFFENGYKFLLYSLVCGGAIFWASVAKSDTFYSYDLLAEELSKNENANVVLDMENNEVNLGGKPGFNVLEGQSVEIKNAVWTNKYTEEVNNYLISNKTHEALNIGNRGTLNIDNVIFKDNESIVATKNKDVFVGSIIRNPYGHIKGITNSVFDNNKLITNWTVYGGLIINGENVKTDAKIDVIQNVKFTNNYFNPGLQIHGGIIHNTGEIGLIDNVLFENNITVTNPNTWASTQGGVIDNNDLGVIKKISNSIFRENKVIRSGEMTESQNGATHLGSSAGIINLYRIDEIDNVIFEKNSVEGDGSASQGGAFANSSGTTTVNPVSIGKITRTKFIDNNVYSKRNSAIAGAMANTRASIGTLEADFIRNSAKSEMSVAYGGALYNKGDIGSLSGEFKNNYVQSVEQNAFGGAIYAGVYEGEGYIGKINADFVGNYAIAGVNGAGGAMYLSAFDTDEIVGDFIGNYIEAENSAYGGAISTAYLSNSLDGVEIGKIVGSYKNNYVVSGAYARGGAISFSPYTIVKDGIYGNFDGNYIIADINGGEGYGGAIGSMGWISEIEGDFTNNYVKGETIKGGAIYVNSIDETEGVGSIKGRFVKNYLDVEEEGYSAHGGAINNDGNINKIEGEFIENYINSDEDFGLDFLWGGAIYNNKNIKSIKADFKGNYNKGPLAYGGAIYNNEGGQIGNINGNFVGNFNEAYLGVAGGGIYNGGEIGSIKGDFVDNFVYSDDFNAEGGAIFNYGNIGEIEGNFVGNYIKSNNFDVEFNRNTDEKIRKYSNTYGGAIYNSGKIDGNGEWVEGIISIKDSSFKNNYAEALVGAKGGAIYNNGIINFLGYNEFSGNYVHNLGIEGDEDKYPASKEFNDIHNTGIINIKERARVEINGGITGYGVINIEKDGVLDAKDAKIRSGEINLEDGAGLAFNINQPKTDNLEQMGGRFEGDINLNGENKLIVSSYIKNGEIRGQGEYLFADNVNDENGDWKVEHKQNGLYDYNIDMGVDENKNKLVMNFERKSTQEVMDSLDVDEEEANMVLSIVGEETGNEQFDYISNEVNKQAQENDGSINQTVNQLKDNTKAQIATIKGGDDVLVKTVNKHLSLMKNSRMKGMASGEISVSKPQVWGTLLYQKAEQSGDDGFDANTRGFVLGGDVKVNRNLLLGAGYSYQESDIKSDNKKLDGRSNSVFGYGEYTTDDNWFMKGVLSYNFSKYKQNKYVVGTNINSKYDAEMLGAHLLVGRNLHLMIGKSRCGRFKVRPNVGLRYYHIDRETYTDSAGFEYASSQSDVLTSVLGIEVSKNMYFLGMAVNPTVFINATYDLINDDIRQFVRLPNGNAYITNAGDDEKFGMEFGISFEMSLRENLKASVVYEFDWQDDYKAHLGMFKFKYLW